MRLCLCILLCVTIRGYSQSTDSLETKYLQPVELLSTRASEQAPVAKTMLSKAAILHYNSGQDLPFILNQTPSVVVNSDAGNGIGYTGIRIRGTDASRINVTLNGIPYNDAESQGTFFVDLPDIASSASSIQVQRGVGTSSNGISSFGGNINIGTNDIVTKKSLEINNSAGSYHSFKNTILVNSGILARHFTVDFRVSSLRSDGYIERAASRLGSYFGSLAYVSSTNTIRINILSGKEKTYQAWNGIDERTLAYNRRYNSAGTEKPGTPYENETDNYTQTHYQAFFNHSFNTHWKSNIAIFFTKGNGYYEQYKANQFLGDYGLPSYQDGNLIIDTTNLVRKLWLSNNFYGTTFSLNYLKRRNTISLGGGWNEYDGNHFGQIIKANVQAAVPENYRWYDLSAYKTDIAVYAKWTRQISPGWQTFADIQLRKVDYRINGFRDNPLVHVKTDWLFFNPKLGITFTRDSTMVYVSYGHSSKEPNRDDFETGLSGKPSAETLNDFELGIEHKYASGNIGLNAYYMLYNNQLVLTGRINDVGAYTRTNIPSSYRAGLEFQATQRVTKWLSLNGNITLSENKLKNFTEFLDDYDNGGQQTQLFKNPTIAFSPAVISWAAVEITPIKQLKVSLVNKFVGKQFLDNTAKDSRSLHSYWVTDARAGYSLQPKSFKTFEIYVQVYNIFSRKYEPNGYSYSYINGGKVTTENFYFPMAPVNFMAGLNIKI